MKSLLATMMVGILVLPNPAFGAGPDEDGPGDVTYTGDTEFAIPLHTCNTTTIRLIYREHKMTLMTRLEDHFQGGVSAHSDDENDEFCERLERDYAAMTAADDCQDCTDPELVDTRYLENSGLSRRQVRVMTSHVDSGPKPQSSGGNLFSNPFVMGLAGGFFGGIVGGFVGNYLFDQFGSPNPQQPGMGRPPGMLPLQPPGILRPPGSPFNLPWTGGMGPGIGGPAMGGMPGYGYGYPGMGGGYAGSPAYTGMPGYGYGYPGMGGGVNPYMGNAYYGSIPSYYYGSPQYGAGYNNYSGYNGGQYQYGTGYNPYAPPVLPMPQSAR